ncbi:MAG: thioredoxin domain-containing protein [Candidatus Eremiobacteraeota bacterium]|nr:thioredoxin domain-containing protein [Candidatus Eremiobacteraeota bacterium]
MASTLHFSPRPNRASEIRWQPWGPQAFELAKDQSKPVLLAISAVWCHWCHVMDETSYSDPGVIDLINEHFVPIRVDNDQRPDVNARYNLGGWPTTAILTPEGEILRGGTYIPPEQMLAFLKQVSDLYAEPANRLEFARRIAEVRSKRTRVPTGTPGALDPNEPARIAAAASGAFDDEYGGFGAEPKFPHTDVLHFLLDLYAREPVGRTQTIVQMSLRAMAGGGMYDHVEGGFFRYSTTRDFSVPHFEKMLEDLGGLLLACARASALFGDDALGRVAADTKRYMDASLWVAGRRGYGGSQDADEQYYGLDKDARARETAPYVDPTIYASWNAQAARALIVGAPLLAAVGVGVREWTQRGLDVLEMLWSDLLVDGLMARYSDGDSARVRGLLGDQAWSGWAALAGFEATGLPIWLERARALVDACEALYDEAAGAYLDRLPDESEPGKVSDPVAPLAENALMARVLLGLHAFQGEERFAVRACSVLERFTVSAERMGVFAAPHASAVLDLLNPPYDIKISGAPSGSAVLRMRDRLLAVGAPPLRVNTIPPELASAGAPADNDGEPVALVCRGTTCFARVRDADAVLESIAREKSSAL